MTCMLVVIPDPHRHGNQTPINSDKLHTMTPNISTGQSYCVANIETPLACLLLCIVKPSSTEGQCKNRYYYRL